MNASPVHQLPKWLKPMNKIIIAAHRLGIAMPMPTLTVVGRKSGKPRTTPVTPYDVDGQRYILGIDGADWVANARACGDAKLTRARKVEPVRLVEVPMAERGPILREFPIKVPTGVDMFVKSGIIENNTPEAFEAAIDRCTAFRVDPASAQPE